MSIQVGFGLGLITVFVGTGTDMFFRACIRESMLEWSSSCTTCVKAPRLEGYLGWGLGLRVKGLGSTSKGRADKQFPECSHGCRYGPNTRRDVVCLDTWSSPCRRSTLDILNFQKRETSRDLFTVLLASHKIQKQFVYHLFNAFDTSRCRKCLPTDVLRP